jgi:glycosyltransferase involved in cell wall biosynthesis
MLLSVAIVTLNEEENLERTLASVRWADEIVVVDSGSTDRTIEIARSFGARVIEREWPGFAVQKNFAIQQCSGMWVLSLDADEELTPELQIQIRSLLPTNPPTDAYFLRRRNLFLGRWIKRGGFYPDPKLRLFRRAAASFSPQFEERPVHETISFNGKSDELDADLIHHAYPTLSTYIEHMDRYSSLGAELLVEKRRTSASIFSFLLNVLVVPHSKFMWDYFFRFGFLDGREGLLLHLYHATYTSWKYAKAWEKARRVVTPAPEPIRSTEAV